MNPEKKVIDNNYVIDRLIGVGGSAFVYKAWDKMLHKYVAVKKIHDEYAKESSFVQMFREEAVNTAKLESENIVRVVNFINEQDNYYIVMEYVNGVNLEYLLNKCEKRNITIPAEIAVHIMLEVIKALDYAHNMKDEITGEPLNIVHRDVSPGNIMLYYDGRVKLADFGIAKAGNLKDKEEKLKSKVNYMSPEQASGGDIDFRSDIYSCGLVLYEILAGEKPYEGGEGIEIWKKAKNAKINFKLLEEKEVDENLINIIKHITQHNPDKRFQKDVEMFIELKKHVSKHGSAKEIEKKYLGFIEQVLEEEIDASEKEKQKDITKKHQSFEIDTEELERESKAAAEYEKEKTKDDLKKIKGRRGKFKVFLIASAGLAGIVAAFLFFTSPDEKTVDTRPFSVKTGLQKAELRLDTIPSGAEIRIIDEYGNDILREYGIEGKSPLYISGKEFGNYTLEVEKEGFGRRVKSLEIIKDQNGVDTTLSGDVEIKEGTYIIRFSVDTYVDSSPRGAVLYVNGERVGNTPYSGRLKTGLNNFVLSRRGYETIGVPDPELDMVNRLRGVCLIDFSIPLEEQSGIDYRFWEVSEREGKEGKNIRIKGYFKTD